LALLCKINQADPVRPEIPMGKAYAMLAPSSDNIIDLGPIKKKEKRERSCM